MFWSHSLSIPKWPNVSHPEPVRRLAFSVLALEQPLVLKWSWRGTMVRLCSYLCLWPLGILMSQLSLHWPTAERSSLRVSCTLLALQFLPVSFCLLPVGLHGHPLTPLASMKSWEQQFCFSWTLVQGCPGDIQRVLNWFLPCPAPPSQSPAMAAERIGLHLFQSETERAEQSREHNQGIYTSKWSVSAPLPGMRSLAAGTCWHGCPMPRVFPDLPQLSLPTALPWHEGILKKIVGKKKGSLDRAQKKILPSCLLVLWTHSWGQAKGANIPWLGRPEPLWKQDWELQPHCFVLSRLSKAKQSHMVAFGLTFLKLSILFQGLCRLYFTLPKKEWAWSEAGKK